MAKLTGSGADDKKKLAIAGALGVVVIGLAFHTLFGGPATTTPQVATGPTGPVVPAAQRHVVRSRGSRAEAAAADTYRPAEPLDPTLHPQWMAATESYRYAGSGRNIFSADSAPPQSAMQIERVKAPIRPTAAQMAAAAMNAGPAGPPPINLRFFGYSQYKNGTRKAFLLQGDNTFIATVGDVVAHRYRVAGITPTAIQVEDLPYHNTQSLPLVVSNPAQP